MTHQHDHQAHNTHDHAHGHGNINTGNERRVLWVMVLTGAFMLAEALGGWWSGSLALLADAGHMLSDSASLLLAFIAFRLGRRAPDRRRTYGYERFQVLAAFVNALALFVIAGWIVFTAIERFFSPITVTTPIMLVIAVLGLVVNVAAFMILHGGNQENLNLRGAFLHVIGDLLGSVAAIAASLIIMFTGWMVADPILSLLAAGLILRAAWQVLKRSAHVLLEGIPEGVDTAAISRELLTLETVESVHDLHVWALTAGSPLLSAHLVAEPDTNRDALMQRAHALLRDRFGLAHTTLQVEGSECLTSGDCGVGSGGQTSDAARSTGIDHA